MSVGIFADSPTSADDYVDVHMNRCRHPQRQRICSELLPQLCNNLLIISRSGNFIIGASGSDKQMLCTSSRAHAALNIAAEKSKQKR